VTEDVFRAWLENYLRPQEQRSAEMIEKVFAEAGVYHWGPFNPARHGLRAIYEHHKNALSHQTDLKYEYEILAVTEGYGIARFHLRLTELMEAEPNEYDGIFLVHLNQHDKCILFEEWYHGKIVPGMSGPPTSDTQ
jgi:hypothetical protein